MLGTRHHLVLLLAVISLCMNACDNDPYCPEDLSWCWAQCVNLMSDENNCGSCDNVCNAGVDCTQGTPTVTASA